jgi:hypothetical protein
MESLGWSSQDEASVEVEEVRRSMLLASLSSSWLLTNSTRLYHQIAAIPARAMSEARRFLLAALQVGATMVGFRFLGKNEDETETSVGDISKTLIDTFVQT